LGQVRALAPAILHGSPLFGYLLALAHGDEAAAA
jgi:hypothetical protein